MRLWTARKGKPWALLNDARNWDAGTSEAFEAWWAFFVDAVAHDLVCATDILPSHFHALMVQELRERGSQLVNYRNSQSLPEALA